MTDDRNRGYYSEEDFERDMGLTHYDRAEEMGLYDDFQKAGRRSKKNQKAEQHGRSKKSKKQAKAGVGSAATSAATTKKAKKQGMGRGEPPRKKSKKKTAIIVLLSILVIVLCGVLLGHGYIKSKLNKVDRVKVSEEDWGIDPKVKEELADYKTIALLGIDARESMGITEDQSRSDAIIIVSINKKTKDVQMTSIMRDTAMDCEEYGGHRLDKIAHQHFFEGPVATVRTLNRNLDLNIDDFVRVDWKTVADVVDSLGGIEIDVPEEQLQELNNYIGESAEAVGQSPQYLEHAGPQTLNGQQALTYCRIRKVDGDEMRGNRQREVIQATIQKAKKTSLSNLNKTIDVGMTNVTTSMDSDTMMDMLLDLSSYNFGDSKSFPSEYEGAWINSLAFVAPSTLKSNVIELHKQLFGQEDYQPTKNVLTINEEIKNRSNVYGDEQPDYELLQEYRVLFPAPTESY